MKLEFFMAMNPPTTTAQEKGVTVKNGKVKFYEPPELKQARANLTSHLARHKPGEKLSGPIELVTKWCFPVKGKHRNGEYRITTPDTDNLQKMLKDCMTRTGYWIDDALVCREIVEKFWSDVPGIYIRVTQIGASDG